MRQILFSAIVLALASAISASSPIKVMTYNIRNGIGIDDSTNLQRVIKTINDVAPDIVAVQEVDSVTARSNGRYILGDLARGCGFQAYYSPAIDFDGGRYGIGILSKSTPISVTHIGLPGSEEPRKLIMLDFGNYKFCCTHLSLTDTDRLTSADTIINLAHSSSVPFFIAGDFNATPGDSVIRTLLENFRPLTDTSVPTFPSDTPVETLDYIMVYTPDSSSVSASSTKVINSIASDHRPVVSEITIKN